MTTAKIIADNGVSTGSAGIKTSGGNDGTLQIQTTTAGGTATTAITIDTSQNVTFANPPSGSGANLTNLNASNLATGTVPTARLASGSATSSTYLRGDQTWAAVAGYAGPNSQLFTSSGTFTVPSGITSVKVTVFAGGGGSGPAPYAGSIGGNGGFAIGVVTGLTSGGTVAVTVGTGGAGGSPGSSGGSSSFGAYVSATGGSGSSSPSGGAFGTGSGGNIRNSTNSDARGTYSGGALTPASVTYNWVSVGSFTGTGQRAGGSTALAPVVWSTSDPSLPGAGGKPGSSGCTTVATGGVGGVVLVEW